MQVHQCFLSFIYIRFVILWFFLAPRQLWVVGVILLLWLSLHSWLCLAAVKWVFGLLLLQIFSAILFRYWYCSWLRGVFLLIMLLLIDSVYIFSTFCNYRLFLFILLLFLANNPLGISLLIMVILLTTISLRSLRCLFLIFFVSIFCSYLLGHW